MLKLNLIKSLDWVSSQGEPSSDRGCEPNLREGISHWTKRYDQVWKLRHNAVKQNILDTCSYELWYKNTSTGLQNMILAFITTGNSISDMFRRDRASLLSTFCLWHRKGCPIQNSSTQLIYDLQDQAQASLAHPTYFNPFNPFQLSLQTSSLNQTQAYKNLNSILWTLQIYLITHLFQNSTSCHPK